MLVPSAVSPAIRIAIIISAVERAIIKLRSIDIGLSAHVGFLCQIVLDLFITLLKPLSFHESLGVAAAVSGGRGFDCRRSLAKNTLVNHSGQVLRRPAQAVKRWSANRRSRNNIPAYRCNEKVSAALHYEPWLIAAEAAFHRSQRDELKGLILAPTPTRALTTAKTGCGARRVQRLRHSLFRGSLHAWTVRRTTHRPRGFYLIFLGFDRIL